MHNSVGSVSSSQQSRAFYDPHTGQVVHQHPSGAQDILRAS